MSDVESTGAAEASLRGFSGTLVLVGAGKMGGALLEGWLRLALDPKRVVVLEPHPSADLAGLVNRGVRLNPDFASLSEAAAVILAVKPQVAPDVVPRLKSLVGASTIVVSIMAGRTLRFLDGALPGAAIVRSMPNTPAAIGRGITVAVPNARVTEAQRAVADTLLRTTGAVEWVGDEDLLDAVTAVSGSGPAYVFLLTETLARAGEAAGLPAELAARLTRATVAGSGELLHRSPLEAAQLRENVTSPGGTTAAALDVLMGKNGLDPLMRKAVAAATERSRKLAE
jgi:pyrroline-5-carboxylate reductase